MQSFWGANFRDEKEIVIPAGHCLTLTNVSSWRPCSFDVKVDGEEFRVAELSPGTLQHSFKLKLFPGSRVILSTRGDSIVHVVGYLTKIEAK